MGINSYIGHGVCSLVCSFGAALAVRELLHTSDSQAHRRFHGYRTRLETDLRFIRANIPSERIIGLQLALLLGGTLGLAFDLLRGALLLLAAVAPLALIKRAKERRVSALEQQIEGWLNSLARALEAAPSLGDALEASLGSCEAPMRQEVEVLVNELHLGHPLDRTLRTWSERVDSRTLTMALSTLQVGRETGGRLGLVLRSAAQSLREMERLEGIVRTKTAEGKTQALVISLMPFPLYFAVQAGDPAYFLPLEASATGNLLIALAVALWIAAGFSARKILAVRI